jgi:hypothetical protein
MNLMRNNFDEIGWQLIIWALFKLSREKFDAGKQSLAHDSQLDRLVPRGQGVVNVPAAEIL